MTTAHTPPPDIPTGERVAAIQHHIRLLAMPVARTLVLLLVAALLILVLLPAAVAGEAVRGGP